VFVFPRLTCRRRAVKLRDLISFSVERGKRGELGGGCGICIQRFEESVVCLLDAVILLLFSHSIEQCASSEAWSRYRAGKQEPIVFLLLA
jgi:hypothetical protein